MIKYTQSCLTCAREFLCVRKHERLCETVQAMVCNEMDIKGPLPKTDRGDRYILVIQDSFSRFAEMFPITEQTIDEVSGKLLEWLS